MVCQLSGELVKRIKALEDLVAQLNNKAEVVMSWQTSIVDSLRELDVRLTEVERLKK